MKRLMVVMLMAVAVLGADKPPDRELLQGTWAYVSAERDGKAVEEEPDAKIRTWVFKGDRLFTTTGTITLQFSFLLDPASMPKALDLTGVSLPIRTRRQLLLYRLDGDTLRICMGTSKVKRPTELTSEHGQTILTFRRARK